MKFNFDELAAGLKRGAEKFGTSLAKKLVKRVEVRNGFAPTEPEPYGLGQGGAATEQTGQNEDPSVKVNGDSSASDLKKQIASLEKQYAQTKSAKVAGDIMDQINALEKKLKGLANADSLDALKARIDEKKNSGESDQQAWDAATPEQRKMWLEQNGIPLGVAAHPWSKLPTHMKEELSEIRAHERKNTDSSNLGFQSGEQSTTAHREDEVKNSDPKSTWDDAAVDARENLLVEYKLSKRYASTDWDSLPANVTATLRDYFKNLKNSAKQNSDSAIMKNEKITKEDWDDATKEERRAILDMLGVPVDTLGKWNLLSPRIQDLIKQLENSDPATGSKCLACGHESESKWSGKCESCGVKNAKDVGGNVTVGDGQFMENAGRKKTFKGPSDKEGSHLLKYKGQKVQIVGSGEHDQILVRFEDGKEDVVYPEELTNSDDHPMFSPSKLGKWFNEHGEQLRGKSRMEVIRILDAANIGDVSRSSLNEIMDAIKEMDNSLNNAASKGYSVKAWWDDADKSQRELLLEDAGVSNSHVMASLHWENLPKSTQAALASMRDSLPNSARANSDSDTHQCDECGKDVSLNRASCISESGDKVWCDECKKKLNLDDDGKEMDNSLNNAGHLGPKSWMAASLEERVQWLESAGQDINEATREWENLSADLHVALQTAKDRPASWNTEEALGGNGNPATPPAQDRLNASDDWEPTPPPKTGTCKACDHPNAKHNAKYSTCSICGCENYLMENSTPNPNPEAWCELCDWNGTEDDWRAHMAKKHGWSKAKIDAAWNEGIENASGKREGKNFRFIDKNGEIHSIFAMDEEDAWDQLSRNFGTPIADIKGMGIKLKNARGDTRDTMKCDKCSFVTQTLEGAERHEEAFPGHIVAPAPPKKNAKQCPDCGGALEVSKTGELVCKDKKCGWKELTNSSAQDLLDDEPPCKCGHEGDAHREPAFETGGPLTLTTPCTKCSCSKYSAARKFKNADGDECPVCFGEGADGEGKECARCGGFGRLENSNDDAPRCPKCNHFFKWHMSRNGCDGTGEDGNVCGCKEPQPVKKNSADPVPLRNSGVTRGNAKYGTKKNDSKFKVGDMVSFEGATWEIVDLGGKGSDGTQWWRIQGDAGAKTAPETGMKKTG